MYVFRGPAFAVLIRCFIWFAFVVAFSLLSHLLVCTHATHAPRPPAHNVNLSGSIHSGPFASFFSFFHSSEVFFGLHVLVVMICLGQSLCISAFARTFNWAPVRSAVYNVVDRKFYRSTYVRHRAGVSGFFASVRSMSTCRENRWVLSWTATLSFDGGCAGVR